MSNLKSRSWLILFIAIGTISLAIGLLLGSEAEILEKFNISPSLIEAFKDFIRQYVSGIPIP